MENEKQPKKELLCAKCSQLFKTVRLTSVCPTCRKSSKRPKFGSEPLFCPACFSGELEPCAWVKAGASHEIKTPITVECKKCGKRSRTHKLLTLGMVNLINNVNGAEVEAPKKEN